jgi:glycosyltransferase involved in cell wall biosynthesis
MARHVVLLLNNAFTSDSRSWKLATSLSSAGDRVTVVARAADGLPERESRDGFEVVRVAQPKPLAWLPAPPLPPGGGVRARRGLRDRVRDSAGRATQALRYLLLARQWARRIGAVVPSADIWQSEGLITLPVALRLRAERGGRVVYDSRDVHVESARFARLPGPWRRLLARGERRWARAADAVVTVSEPYADVLRRMLGVEPVIVMNGPVSWHVPEPRPRRFHEAFGLAPSTRVVLSLGALQPHRGLEELVDAIGLVGDAVLVFVGDGSHKSAVEARAAAAPHRDRVFFLPACPPDEILPLNASADVAAMPVQPSTLNHRLNTPTKLFDAMGAGTPVVASDLPGMASIVRAAGNGVLCDPASPPDIARAIRAILDAPPERREALRAAGLRAARDVYGWDRQVEQLLELYDRIDPLDGAR